ncbi:hypothetical protein ZIOFF_010032 [Zingiber officinale]|uniref:HAT C-terminal dimerisation domain-containing protein n=1 Tax=Zingiber officinale TaxID=94328 RepID=A0A8J5LRV0_ZINOF|nr:hypothetical protein ZIOFF_010032 [Zingiber officinale]
MLLINAINEVGHQNVVKVAINTTPVCKAIALLVEKYLENMVISERCDMYKEEDVVKARVVRVGLNDRENERCDLYKSMRVGLNGRENESCYLKGALYSGDSKFYEVVHNIPVERWNKSNTPLHCLAHSLNPRYYNHEWLQESHNHPLSHRDIKVSRERKKCIKRYYPNSFERRSVNEEFASFSATIDDFSNNDAMLDRCLMSPTKWWVIHGACTPTLQSLALKLLRQPSSSSSCERNWSTYSCIHSLKRNKITTQRAEDLVYVHYNLCLLSRRTRHYSEGESKMWDVGADGFDSIDIEGVAILEIVNLSLDEPKLESVLFANKGGVGDETNMDV